MSTLEKRLEDPEYKAWVKCGLCLAYVKGGLEEFANERSKRAHNIVITEVVKTNFYNNVCPTAVDVRQRSGCWQMDCCCNNCDEYVKQIDKLKTPGFSFNKFNWKNSNIQLWPTDAWEMMKVFMNQGQKAFQNNAQDSDLSAILNFIDHCHIPKVDIANQTNIAKVILCVITFILLSQKLLTHHMPIFYQRLKISCTVAAVCNRHMLESIVENNLQV